ncbi:hypothetical protein ACFFX1_49330 [Dactylosporangium sucinum]|uniref:Uncharacterized protein n=1 Tax=Dactylosporangium sucinum TaxID=1424081 RepID=A0A917UFW8_9ACTN|nr:hypothetical protein [Dactylosporangium sucinum]GGM90037.1 hypothetical protein GCM10007977_110120 [Dactylosporangium sucinum]
MSTTDQTASPGPAEQAPALVTLPHSGVQVPDAALRVTSLRQLPTRDGVAFQAVLRRGRNRVGTVENEGRGGETSFYPAAPNLFGYAELNAFADACRTASGGPCSTEQLLNELVNEYDTARIVTADARRGRVTVRLMAPVIEGDPDLYTAEFASVGVPSGTAPNLAEVARVLATTRPAGPRGRWQYWTGAAWQTLPDPAAAATSG